MSPPSRPSADGDEAGDGPPGPGRDAGERAADGGWRASRRAFEARLHDEQRRRRAGPPGNRQGAPWDGLRGRAGQRGRREQRAAWNRPWAADSARPEWWPADEAWPPRRHRPWRGFGCLFAILVLAGALGLLSFAVGIVGTLIAAPGPLGIAIRVAAIAVAVGVTIGFIRAARSIRGSGTVLDDLVEQAARVEAGDYAARVEILGPVPPPVRSLARGFNTMAARLEADEAQRRTLLADVTHELRTPLAVVQGSVEAILDGVHPPDETHLTAILDETRVLDRLIEDLRTLALSESGALSLHREPTDLAILVTDAAISFAAAAAAAGVEIATTLDDDLPLLEVDPVRMREVVGNLVANALRHTPAGGRIEIEARTAREPSGSWIEVAVRDTGSGIDAELLPHVFERFARGAGSSGSGLGLSIARGLVELHGGTIAASSPPGTGATIVIRLPDPGRRG